MSKQKRRKKLAVLFGAAIFSSAISVTGVGAGLYHWNYNYYNPYLISFGNTEKGNLTVEITVPNAAGKEVWGHFVDQNGKTYVIKGDVDVEGKIVFDTTILPSPGKYNLESIWDKEHPSSEDKALVPNEKLPKKAKEDIVKPEIAINATPEGKISLDFNKQLAGKEAEATFKGLDGTEVKVRGIIDENGQLIINHKDHSLFPNNNYYTLELVVDAKNPNQKLVNLDEIHPKLAIDKLLYDGYRDHNDKGDVFITSGLSKENANREVKAIFKDTNGEIYEIEGTTDAEGRVNFDTSVLPKGTWQLDKIVDAKENEIILKDKDGTEGKRNKFDLPELGPIHRPAIIIETSNPSDLKIDVDNHLKGDELVANFKGVDGKDYPLSAIVDEAGKIIFDTSKLPEGQEYTLDSIKDKDGKDAINLNDPLITDDIKESFVIDKRARGHYQDQNGNEIKVPLIEDNNGKLIPDPKFVDTVENGDHLIFDNTKGILDSQGNKKPNELLSDTGQEIDKRVIANYPDLDQKDQNIYLIKDKDGNWKPDPKEVAKLPEGNKWVFDEKTSFKDSKGEEITDDAQKPILSDENKVIDKRPVATFKDSNDSSKVTEVPMVTNDEGKLIPDPEFVKTLPDDKKGFEYKIDESAGFKDSKNQPFEVKTPVADNGKVIDTRPKLTFKDEYGNIVEIPLVREGDKLVLDPETVKNLETGKIWTQDETVPIKYPDGVEPIAPEPTLEDKNKTIDTRVKTIYKDKDGKDQEIILIKDKDGIWKPDPKEVEKLPEGNKWIFDENAIFTDLEGNQITDPNQKPTLVDPNNVIDKRPVATFEDPKDPSKTLEVPMVTNTNGELIPDPEFVKIIPDDKKGVEYKIKEPTEFKDANGEIVNITTPVADNGKVIDTRPSVTYIDQDGNTKDVLLVKEGDKWVPDPIAKSELEDGKKWKHDESAGVKYPENIQPINPEPTLEDKDKLIDTRIIGIFEDKNGNELKVPLIKDKDGNWKPDPEFVKDLPDGNRWILNENKPFTNVSGEEITDPTKKPTLSADDKVIDTRPSATYIDQDGNKKQVPLIKNGDKLTPDPEIVKELEKGKIWTQDEAAGIKYPGDGNPTDPNLSLNDKDKIIDTRISGTFNDQSGTPRDILLIKDKDGVWKPDPKEVEKLPNGDKWTLDPNGKFKDVNGQEITEPSDKPVVNDPNNIIDKRPSATFKDQNGVVQEVPLIKDKNGVWQPDPEAVKELEKGKIWTQDESVGIKYPAGVQPDNPQPTLANKVIDTRVKAIFKDQNGNPSEIILIKDKDGIWKPDPEFVKTLPDGYKWTLDENAPFKDLDGNEIIDEAQKPKLTDPNNVIDKRVKTIYQDNPTNPTKTLEVPMVVDNNGKLIPDPEFVKSISDDKKGVEYKIKEPMVFINSNGQTTTSVPSLADNGNVIDTRPTVTLKDEMGNIYNVPMVKEGDKWMPDKTSEEYKKIPNGQILTNEGVQQPTGGVSPISPTPILSNDFNLDRRYNVTYTSDKGDSVTIKVSLKGDQFSISPEEDAKLGVGKIWTASKVADVDNKEVTDIKSKLDKSDKQVIDKRMSITTFAQDEHQGVSHTNAFLSASFGVKGTNPSYSFAGKKVKFTFTEIDANGNEVSGTLKETNELTLDANGGVKWEQQGLEAGKRYKYKSISYLTDIADTSTLPDEIQTDKMFYTLNVAPTIASIRTLRSTHNTYSMTDVETDSVNGRDKFTTKTEITFNDPNNYLDWTSLMDKANLSINMQNFDTNTNTDKLNIANVAISRNGNTLEITHSGDLKEILAKKLYPVLSNISYTKNAINQKGQLTLDKLNGTDELVTSTVQQVMIKDLYTTTSFVGYADVKATIFDPLGLLKATTNSESDFNSHLTTSFQDGVENSINLKLVGKEWQEAGDSYTGDGANRRNIGKNERFMVNFDRTRLKVDSRFFEFSGRTVPSVAKGLKFKQSIDPNVTYKTLEINAHKYKIFAKNNKTKEINWRYKFGSDQGFTHFKIAYDSFIGNFEEKVAIANNNENFFFNSLPSYNVPLGSNNSNSNKFLPNQIKTEDVFQNSNFIGMKSINFDANNNKFILELNIPNGVDLSKDAYNNNICMWMMLKDNDGNTYLAMSKTGEAIQMNKNGPFEFYINDIQGIGDDQKINAGTELHFSDIWLEPVHSSIGPNPFMRPLILVNNNRPEDVYKRFWVKKK